MATKINAKYKVPKVPEPSSIEDCAYNRPGPDLPCLEQFAEHLRRRECSPLTVTNYLADLRAFARWFEQTKGDGLTPDRITPTDLREFKQHLAQRGSWSNSV